MFIISHIVLNLNINSENKNSKKELKKEKKKISFTYSSYLRNILYTTKRRMYTHTCTHHTHLTTLDKFQSPFCKYNSWAGFTTKNG